MRRAPLVLAATVVGVAFVLGAHPRSQVKASPPATVSAPPPAGSAPSGSTPGGSTPGASRTVLGADETINDGTTFGDLQVKVTASGGRITSVGMARLNVNGPQSQQISNMVIPQLEQQALASQSANIQGVSGATYTSQAYAASLQAALDQLGPLS
jgi:uncharacterized protein with FMN-binding domain